MKKNTIVAILIGLNAFIPLLSGCGSSNQSHSSGAELWSPVSTDIPSTDPASVGFDADKLNAAFVKAQNQTNMQSLIVIKNESLVGEAYFGSSSSSTLFHERSVTKTVIAMLIGIAIDEGAIESIEQPIGPYFESSYGDLSPDKQAITIRHLLTMTSGFDWDEGGYLNWERSSDPQGYLLNRDLIDSPGTNFTYNSAAVHLLSVILTKATNMNTYQFAREKLFTPLGITQVAWDRLADGYYNGGAGLQLRPIDLAKLGLLFINDGIWQQSQIIPQYWILDAKAVHFYIDAEFGAFKSINYGFLWVLGTGNDHELQLAWGWGGQFVFTIPSEQLVVVTNSPWQVNANTADIQEELAINLVLEDIIDALN